MPDITVNLIRSRIEDLPAAPAPGVPSGAQLEFRGLVRADEHGHRITALEYAGYVPMAQRVLERLAHEWVGQHACLAARIVHRLGVIPVGDAAVLVQVCSRHRQEGLRFLEDFLNSLKREVPIWKVRALTDPAITRLTAHQLSSEAGDPTSVPAPRSENAPGKPQLASPVEP